MLCSSVIIGLSKLPSHNTTGGGGYYYFWFDFWGEDAPAQVDI